MPKDVLSPFLELIVLNEQLNRGAQEIRIGFSYVMTILTFKSNKFESDLHVGTWRFSRFLNGIWWGVLFTIGENRIQKFASFNIGEQLRQLKILISKILDSSGIKEASQRKEENIKFINRLNISQISSKNINGLRNQISLKAGQKEFESDCVSSRHQAETLWERH